ncbi:spore coat U domain-containing protein [Acidovorax sp. sic0104]|uniref:Csu type fimbrial protein n=1 Tax=Acidovorax sp. sic0104 TaxID=2854784 RepID=UPI001C45D3D6|nr:spore coat U domain-containing protein [Acidovorax sp. sic0104]MBV7540989.1 spore coat U domain-containing protein [Acidovorax sp. sic0104]
MKNHTQVRAAAPARADRPTVLRPLPWLVRALRLALVALPVAALAATIPTNPSFSVSASVVRGCAVSGNTGQVSGIPFGSINFGSHPALQSGALQSMAGSSMGSQAKLVCTPGTAVQISVDGGQNRVGAQRRMSNGAGKYVPYDLELVQGTPALLAPNVPVGLVIDATPLALPVRGTATLPGATAAAGIYADTVQVTLSW